MLNTGILFQCALLQYCLSCEKHLFFNVIKKTLQVLQIILLFALKITLPNAYGDFPLLKLCFRMTDVSEF